ncbi:glycine cleavage T C-terminal barrel domain-containing protein [Glaciimonas sp. PCH181]|uniref:2Fe-2S iron-sulfur cluster-binding protein n=1 Tax=Glaciimonas sp. PCH181 TaxID=2133943 RepID=UPI000D37D267|nr:glycine cleavage T C-terminal barrel domain-containing protein [Glaciimonas sp. PCH181]PUA17763.1 aminomethyltransferase [Glaciimonas sp. PCH181]
MRLQPVTGEWINRQTTVEFQFEGQTYRGYAGDTITSAIWSADTRLLGRSFKYHRPRGVLSLANHDINVLMQDGQRLNVRADVEPIPANRALTAVNTFGGLSADSGRWLNKMSAFLPVGFYYKAFHTKKLFPMWEKVFRRLTGLGEIDFSTPHRRTPKSYDFCDVLVIGAGPSGLAAALAAVKAGAEVVIVDENARAGGSAGYQRGGSSVSFKRIEALLAEVAAEPRIRLLESTMAGAYYADHWVPLIDAEKLTKMRAKSVVVASGAFEQPAVFHNNDLPGVMLASAAQRLMYRYAVQPMQRVVLLVANADGYRAALDLDANGVQVAALVDMRPNHLMAELDIAVLKRGIKIFRSHCVLEAEAAAGGKAVGAAIICPIDRKGAANPAEQVRLECDGIVMSVGWAPTANLLYQAGTKMQFAEATQQFVPEQLPNGVFACGRVNGVYEFERKLIDGEQAGRAAAAYIGHGTAQVARALPEIESPSHPWPIVAHPKAKNFVDFDEDLQLKDFENAVQEGFDNIELLKRYTTVGMGPSQGKHSNMNALRILARLVGKTPGQVGTTTARPFFHPVPMSHLAGRGFTPERLTPLHHQHQQLNAVFMPAGVWQRPEYYARVGQDRTSCIRAEVAAVRNGVGMIDVGTLGKIEIYGPDAAAFLERVYISSYANLKVGMSRYAVMCDESGVVIDDGVVARLGEQHFYFTTTTSGAAEVYRELTRLNILWGMNCGLVNLTGAMAAMNLAGPKSLAVLEQLTDQDLSSTAFPYLAVRDATVATIPVRIMRVGFVGEWGYEIHVPAEYANTLWEALWEAGKSAGICAFGVEAQRLLRLEKGHIIIGQDTDGLTTPFEANLRWAVKMNKPFFIGQRSLGIVDRKPLRQTLVGFVLGVGYNGTVPKECHLIIEQGEIAGRITSIAWSPGLERFIGLAFVRPDLSTVGQSVSIRLSDGGLVTATVHETPFYDPANARQKNVREETRIKEEVV